MSAGGERTPNRQEQRLFSIRVPRFRARNSAPLRLRIVRPQRPTGDSSNESETRIESVDAVAMAWAATDELTGDHWSADDAGVVLRQLGALARQALRDGTELWYWWSL